MPWTGRTWTAEPAKSPDDREREESELREEIAAVHAEVLELKVEMAIGGPEFDPRIPKMRRPRTEW